MARWPKKGSRWWDQVGVCVKEREHQRERVAWSMLEDQVNPFTCEHLPESNLRCRFWMTRPLHHRTVATPFGLGSRYLRELTERAAQSGASFSKQSHLNVYDCLCILGTHFSSQTDRPMQISFGDFCMMLLFLRSSSPWYLMIVRVDSRTD